MTHLPLVPLACPLPYSRSRHRNVSCSSHRSDQHKSNVSDLMINSKLLKFTRNSKQTYAKAHVYSVTCGLEKIHS